MIDCRRTRGRRRSPAALLALAALVAAGCGGGESVSDDGSSGTVSVEPGADVGGRRPSVQEGPPGMGGPVEPELRPESGAEPEPGAGGGTLRDGEPPGQTRGFGDPTGGSLDLDVLQRTDPDGSRAEPGPADPAEVAVAAPPSLRAGTRITVTSDVEISTERQVAGEVVIATVADDLFAPDGMVLIPRGAKLLGRILRSESSTGPDVDPVLEIEFETLSTPRWERSIRAVVIEADIQGSRKDSGTKTAAKIGGGVAAGALLGKILGKNGEAVVKGGVAGGVAGTVLALETRPGEATLAAGATLVVELEETLILQ